MTRVSEYRFVVGVASRLKKKETNSQMERNWSNVRESQDLDKHHDDDESCEGELRESSKQPSLYAQVKLCTTFMLCFGLLYLIFISNEL